MRRQHFCAGGFIYGFVICAAAMAQPLYRVTDLGDLGGSFKDSRAESLNNLGQVTGNSNAPGSSFSHAFLWSSGGGMIDLGDFAGGNDESLGHAINDLGHVVGAGSVAKQDGSDSGIRPFLWTSGGGLQNLGRPAGSDGASANGINALDQVIGHSFSSSGTVHHAFMWTSGGGFTDLGDLPNGMNYVFANDINDSSVVVGTSNSPNNARAWRWTSAGGMQKLADLSSVVPDSYAAAINSQNWIVGDSHDGVNKYRAVLWNPAGGVMDLGALSGGIEESGANSINSLRQVVGNSNIGTDESEIYRAFLWTPDNGIRNLNDLLDASGNGWTLNTATDINEAGQIVGTGVHCIAATCVEHAYLLTPVPEPVFASLLIPIAVMARRRRGVR